MKAVVQDGYGSADVLRLREVDRPAYRDGEVLVRVRAAGVEPGVRELLAGRPYRLRLRGSGVSRSEVSRSEVSRSEVSRSGPPGSGPSRSGAFGSGRSGCGRCRPRTVVRGREVAGVVEAVGGAVSRFRPGDEVFGTCESGSFAEFAAAREDRLAAKPAQLSFEQAAVTALRGVIALQAVRDAARVRPGHRVLVTGAAGGTGSFTVQVARTFGAVVTGMSGPDTLDLVRSLGAEDVLDDTRTEVDCNGPWYDVLVDTTGNRPLRLLRRALVPGGTLVLVGGEPDGRPGGTGRLPDALAPVLLGRRIRRPAGTPDVDDLEDLAALVVSGVIRPVIEHSYPLAQAADAVRQVLGGKVAGTVVVTV